MAKSLSYAERHAKARETFERFLPDVDPERVAASLEKRLGALGSMAFDVVGAMWARPELSRRDRSLFIIAVLAAQARDEELKTHTRIGLRHGLKREEIEEILLHVASYAGFPAAMAASRNIDAALREAEGVDQLCERKGAARKADAERDRDADVVTRAMLGDPDGSASRLPRLEAQLGEAGVVFHRWVLGEIWSRKELSRRDRSIVVIGIFTSLGATNELGAHLEAALANGLAPVEIEEIVNHLSLYVGGPRAHDAMRVVRHGLKTMDKGA